MLGPCSYLSYESYDCALVQCSGDAIAFHMFWFHDDDLDFFSLQTKCTTASLRSMLESGASCSIVELVSILIVIGGYSVPSSKEAGFS